MGGLLVLVVGGPLMVAGFGPLVVMMVGRCGLTKKDGLSFALFGRHRSRNMNRRGTKGKDIKPNRDASLILMSLNFQTTMNMTRRAPHKNTTRPSNAILILVILESISG